MNFLILLLICSIITNIIFGYGFVHFYNEWCIDEHIIKKASEIMTNEELEKELEKTKNSLYKLLSCLYGHTLGQGDIDFIMSDKPAFRQDNKD